MCHFLLLAVLAVYGSTSSITIPCRSIVIRDSVRYETLLRISCETELILGYNKGNNKVVKEREEYEMVPGGQYFQNPQGYT